MPESRTSSTTSGPSRTQLTLSWPPGGVNFTAFEIRLATTRSNWAASACMVMPRSRSSRSLSRLSWMAGRNDSRTSSMTAAGRTSASSIRRVPASMRDSSSRSSMSASRRRPLRWTMPITRSCSGFSRPARPPSSISR